MKGKLYQIDIPTPPNDRALGSRQVWDHRLAHIQPASPMQMAKSNAVKGFDNKNFATRNMTCRICALGKVHRQAIPQKADPRSTKFPELVHPEVNIPVEGPSLGGSRYFITFIYDYSRWTTSHTMKKKSEIFFISRNTIPVVRSTSKLELVPSASSNGLRILFKSSRNFELTTEENICQANSGPTSYSTVCNIN